MISLKKLRESDNIAELLDNQQLREIGQQVVKGYEIDEASRTEWKEIVDHVMKIMNQKLEHKNTPWHRSSNLKFPIITKAVLNYVARTIPEYIQGDQVVKCKTVGADPQQLKFKRAYNVSTFMSWQLLNDMPGWKVGLDKLFTVVATRGVAFKKTYYDELRERPVSELCLPDKICVNHDIKCLYDAPRITHIIEKSQNDITERQRAGLYLEDIKLEELRDFDAMEIGGDKVEAPNPEDKDFPVYLLEQHCFLDLDKDGYKEPYIVTVHKLSGKVLRIYNRFGEIKHNKKGEVQYIEAEQYFTDYHFIHNADGGFYSHGLGTLMLPFNHAANTLWNQLVNAGTLSTTSTGFINNGFRIKNGEFKIKMGEYIPVGASSTTDISKALYTIPFKEPSNVLMQLLEMLLKACDELAGVTDASQGKESATNTSNGVMDTLIEQSTKVFAAINDRIYDSQAEEYYKIYKINSRTLDNKKYREILGDDQASVKADFELDLMNVIPVADPKNSSLNQRVRKAILVQSLKTVDPRAADQYILDAMQIEKSQAQLLLPPKDPKAPPPLPDQLTQSQISLNQANAAKLAGDSQQAQAQLQLEAQKVQLEAPVKQSQVDESNVRQWKMQKDAAHNDIKNAITQSKMQSEQTIKAGHLQLEAKKNQDDTAIKTAQLGVQKDKVAGDTGMKAAKIVADAHSQQHDLNQDTAKTIFNAKTQLESQQLGQEQQQEQGEPNETGGEV